MSDLTAYLSRVKTALSGSTQSRQVSELIFNTNQEENLFVLNDRRLNEIAALTWNKTTCDEIFDVLEKALTPEDYPWKILHNALLVLHTIVLFGSEIAVDKAVNIARFVFALQNYNSALVKRNSIFGSAMGGVSGHSSGGTDKGEPVRIAAKNLFYILNNDNNIRTARKDARGESNTLVPLGDTYVSPTNNNNNDLLSGIGFGQGVDTSVGAGFSLQQVPGMYEGRPDRYFDNTNDQRNRNVTTGDHQFTREAVAPSLLDLEISSNANGESGTTNSNNNNNVDASVFLMDVQNQQQMAAELADTKAQLMRLQNLQQGGGGSGVPLTSGLGLGLDGLSMNMNSNNNIMNNMGMNCNTNMNGSMMLGQNGGPIMPPVNHINNNINTNNNTNNNSDLLGLGMTQTSHMLTTTNMNSNTMNNINMPTNNPNPMNSNTMNNINMNNINVSSQLSVPSSGMPMPMSMPQYASTPAPMSVQSIVSGASSSGSSSNQSNNNFMNSINMNTMGLTSGTSAGMMSNPNPNNNNNSNYNNYNTYNNNGETMNNWGQTSLAPRPTVDAAQLVPDVIDSSVPSYAPPPPPG